MLCVFVCLFGVCVCVWFVCLFVVVFGGKVVAGNLWKLLVHGALPCARRASISFSRLFSVCGQRSSDTRD